MKKRILIALGVLVLAAGIGAGGWYYYTHHAGSSGGSDIVYVTKISKLSEMDSGVENRYAGVVEPQETVQIKIESGRKVKEVQVKTGQEVKKGQLLFQYDLGSIQQSLQEAQLALDRLKNEQLSISDQITTLEAEKKKATADNQLSYTIEIETQKMNLKKNEYDQKSKQAEIDKLSQATQNTEVRSEIDGVIQKIDTSKMGGDDSNGVEDTLTEGTADSTDSSSGNGSGTAFITILSTGAYRVKGTVNEINRDSIIEGTPVIIRSRVDSSKTWKGTMGSVDMDNSTSNSNSDMAMFGMSSASDDQTSSSTYPFYVNLDSSEGLMLGQHVYIEPDEETLERYQKQKEEEEKKQKLLLELKGKETITKGGKKINLYANIGGVSDVAEVLANDANGIGLFRSEFLYLQSETFPTEEEQFRAYKTVVETMAGKKVIVRTLDIGADKQVDYFGLDKEDNPALGYRAIRICLKQPDIFRTQLRAIYRASHYGTLSIMFPMIISVDEVRVIKRIVNEVKSELDKQEIPYGTVELGIMIETPAAVMISDLLAKEVDFFSIGTNDLTQYTLAIDRQNPKLDDFYNSHHEAVLRMIRMVVENGHKEGCWVGICGELGADTSLTETFVSMGIDELSVSPSMVLKVREAVRNIED